MRSGFLSVTAVLVTLAAAFAAPAARAAPPPAYFPSYPAAGAGYEQRPATVKIASGASWQLDRWEGWGGAQATARGTYRDHPATEGIDEPGTLTLSRPVRCGPTLVYTRMSGVLDSSRTDTAGTAPLQLRPNCRPVVPTNVIAWTLADSFPRSRPPRIGLSKIAELRNLRWTRWGGPVAVATGTAYLAPLCGRGRWCPRQAPAHARLSKLGWCGAALAYQRVTVRSRLFPRSGTTDVSRLCRT